MQADARVVLELLFRRERSQILATLIRLTGDFNTAEDSLQEAFAEVSAIVDVRVRHGRRLC